MESEPCGCGALALPKATRGKLTGRFTVKVESQAPGGLGSPEERLIFLPPAPGLARGPALAGPTATFRAPPPVSLRGDSDKRTQLDGNRAGARAGRVRERRFRVGRRRVARPWTLARGGRAPARSGRTQVTTSAPGGSTKPHSPYKGRLGAAGRGGAGRGGGGAPILLAPPRAPDYLGVDFSCLGEAPPVMPPGPPRPFGVSPFPPLPAPLGLDRLALWLWAGFYLLPQ